MKFLFSFGGNGNRAFQGAKIGAARMKKLIEII